MKNKLQKYYFAVILFLIFMAGALVFIWFQKPYPLDGGESGLFFYNPLYLLREANSTWASPELGTPTSLSIIGLPLYVIMVGLSHVLQGFQMQALLFWILLLVPGVFLFIFQKSFSLLARFFTVIFYTCNIGGMVLIWNRMQYPYLFFYALLPLTFFFFQKGVEKKNLFYIPLWLFSSVFFVISFASFPLIEVLWMVLFAYIVFFTIIFWKDKKSILFGWFYFAISLVGWIGVNAWWILPFYHSLKNSPYIAGQAYVASSDIQTFISLSHNLGKLSFIFRLMHSDFFAGITQEWGNAYNQPIFTILSFIIPLLAFFPLLLRKKPTILYFFLLLSLLITFFMKGSSEPLGGISLFLISHIRLLEPFRNPFEKFGLILPFAYAPLVGYSLYRWYLFLARKLSPKKAKIVLTSAAVILFGILVYPMWNGQVFMSTVIPLNNNKVRYFVHVPEYYASANMWLNKEPGVFRALALPMSTEGITYNWDYGYNGVESSNILFDRPIISFITSMQFLENIANQVQEAFFKMPEHFDTFLSLLGAKYIMIRSDVNFVDRQLANPVRFTSLITSHPEKFQAFTYEKTFGKLAFYRNTSYTDIAYPVKTVFADSLYTPLIDAIDLLQVGSGDALLNTDTDLSHQQFILANASGALIQASKIIDYGTFPTLTLSDALKQLPPIQSLPTSRLYPLIRFKEYLEEAATTSNEEKLQYFLLLSNKRLEELFLLSQTGDQTQILKATQRYVQSLTTISQFMKTVGQTALLNTSDKLYGFRSVFVAQHLILSHLLATNNSSLVAQTLSNTLISLSTFSQQNNAEPIFAPIQTAAFGKNRLIYSLDIPQEGTYEIVVKKDDYTKYNELFPHEQEIQIDNNLQQVKLTEDATWIHVGTFSFAKGYHELQIALPTVKNLAEKTELLLTADQKDAKQSVSFENFDPYAHYVIAFDYWIQKGTIMSFSIQGAVGAKNSTTTAYKKTYVVDGYNHGFQSVSLEFTPNTNMINQSLVFGASPDNTCSALNGTDIVNNIRCHTDRTYNLQFNRPTVVEFKNIRIERLFTEPLYAKDQTNKPFTASQIPTITAKKISPAEYRVHVANAQSPFFLVLSESYHPLWKGTFVDTKAVLSEDRHFIANSYANAWYIARNGSYDIDFLYTSETLFSLGKLVSFGAGILMLVGCLGFLVYKKYVKRS